MQRMRARGVSQLTFEDSGIVNSKWEIVNSQTAVISRQQTARAASSRTHAVFLVRDLSSFEVWVGSGLYVDLFVDVFEPFETFND